MEKHVLSYGEMIALGTVGAALLVSIYSTVAGPGPSELQHDLFETAAAPTVWLPVPAR